MSSVFSKGVTRRGPEPLSIECCLALLRTNNEYAAFTLNDFDYQKRNLMFVKMTFQVFKLEFLVCCMKQAFYPLHKQNIAQAWQQENIFMQAFRSVPDCLSCMCKRGIRFIFLD